MEEADWDHGCRWNSGRDPPRKVVGTPVIHRQTRRWKAEEVTLVWGNPPMKGWGPPIERGGANITQELTTPHSTWGLGKTIRIRARRAVRRRDPRNTYWRDAVGVNRKGRFDDNGGNPAAD
jgi:hypothetical protein